MNIALAAHDNRKILMENFCIAYRHILSKHTIYATGTTGWLIEEATGLTLNKYLAGHVGGEKQLCVQISHNDIDLVIFMCDPDAHTHSESDFTEVARLCDMHNIPFASNLATAEVLILALDQGDLNWREFVKNRGMDGRA
jgi:methylglyoxal synthase